MGKQQYHCIIIARLDRRHLVPLWWFKQAVTIFLFGKVKYLNISRKFMRMQMKNIFSQRGGVQGMIVFSRRGTKLVFELNKFNFPEKEARTFLPRPPLDPHMTYSLFTQVLQLLLQNYWESCEWGKKDKNVRIYFIFSLQWHQFLCTIHIKTIYCSTCQVNVNCWSKNFKNLVRG